MRAHRSNRAGNLRNLHSGTHASLHYRSSQSGPGASRGREGSAKPTRTGAKSFGFLMFGSCLFHKEM